MPRDGSGVFSAPAGTTATPNAVIESSKYNALVADLVSDANAARPITAGGTGATSASAARTALAVGGTGTTNTWTAAQTFSSPIRAANGTVSLPGMAFSGDPDTGIWSVGANSLGVATAGANVATFNSGSGIALASNLAITWGGSGAATTRTNLGAAGLTDNNTFTQTNIFPGANGLRVQSSSAGTGQAYVRFQDSGGTSLGYCGAGSASGNAVQLISNTGDVDVTAAAILNLEAGSNGVRSATARDDTTATGANCLINTSNGQFQRSTSSRRYKTDIEDADYALAESVVLNSRPVWYRSLCEADNAGWSYWGFIAEEVAELDPRLVHWGYPLVVDKDGRNVPDETQPMRPESVMYDRYVVHLTAVIQNQQKTIEAMEARLAALEAK